MWGLRACAAPPTYQGPARVARRQSVSVEHRRAATQRARRENQEKRERKQEGPMPRWPQLECGTIVGSGAGITPAPSERDAPAAVALDAATGKSRGRRSRRPVQCACCSYAFGPASWQEESDRQAPMPRPSHMLHRTPNRKPTCAQRARRCCCGGCSLSSFRRRPARSLSRPCVRCAAPASRGPRQHPGGQSQRCPQRR